MMMTQKEMKCSAQNCSVEIKIQFHWSFSHIVKSRQRFTANCRKDTGIKYLDIVLRYRYLPLVRPDCVIKRK